MSTLQELISIYGIEVREIKRLQGEEEPAEIAARGLDRQRLREDNANEFWMVDLVSGDRRMHVPAWSHRCVPTVERVLRDLLLDADYAIDEPTVEVVQAYLLQEAASEQRVAWLRTPLPSLTSEDRAAVESSTLLLVYRLEHPDPQSSLISLLDWYKIRYEWLQRQTAQLRTFLKPNFEVFLQAVLAEEGRE